MIIAVLLFLIITPMLKQLLNYNYDIKVRVIQNVAFIILNLFIIWATLFKSRILFILVPAIWLYSWQRTLYLSAPMTEQLAREILNIQDIILTKEIIVTAESNHPDAQMAKKFLLNLFINH